MSIGEPFSWEPAAFEGSNGKNLRESIKTECKVHRI